MANRPTQYQKLSLQLDAENKRLKAKLAATRKDFMGLGKQAKMLGGYLAGAFAIQNIVGLGKQIFNLNVEFGGMISRVQALTGASDELTKVLSEQAQTLGKRTQFTATQAAEAMTYLAQAGLKVNDIYKAMPGVLELAASGQVSLAEAADISTNIMSAYALNADDLGRVNDVIANTTTNANTNVIEFAEAFKMVGPIAKAANYSLEEVSAQIGILANAGIKGTMAGTSLRAMIAKLINPSSEASEVINKLGIKTLNLDGTLRPLNDIMTDVQKSGASLGEIFKVFDNRAAAAAVVLEQATPTFNEFVDVVSRSGTAAEIAAKQLDNLKGDTLKLDSAWQGLMLTIGQDSDNLLRSFVSALTNDLQKISDWVEGVTPRFRRWRDSVVDMGLSSGQLSKQIELLKGKLEETRKEVDGMTSTRNDKYFKDQVKNLEGYEQQLAFLEDQLLLTKEAEKNMVNAPAEDDPTGGQVDLVSTGIKRDTFGTELAAELEEAFNKQLEEELDLKQELNAIDQQRLDSIKGFNEQLFGGLPTELADSLTAWNTFLETKDTVLQGWVSISEVVQQTASGIGSAKENWAAMASVAISGLARITPLIQEQIQNIRKLMVAKKAQGVASAIASGAEQPFPMNLIAIASGVATVLSTIAPFVGSFARGTDYVPKTGMAMVHKGEKIIPRGKSGGGPVEFMIRGANLYAVMDEYNSRRDNSY